MYRFRYTHSRHWRPKKKWCKLTGSSGRTVHGAAILHNTAQQGYTTVTHTVTDSSDSSPLFLVVTHSHLHCQENSFCSSSHFRLPRQAQVTKHRCTRLWSSRQHSKRNTARNRLSPVVRPKLAAAKATSPCPQVGIVVCSSHAAVTFPWPPPPREPIRLERCGGDKQTTIRQTGKKASRRAPTVALWHRAVQRQTITRLFIGRRVSIEGGA